jgi:rhamnosyltransferase
MKIAAVVVTYYPEQRVLARLINAVTSQVDAVLVVDNGSDDRSVEWIDGCAAGLVSLLRLDRNLGVAAAQNRGMMWAKEEQFDYVILFDQDSEPALGMVQILMAVAETQKSAGIPVAAVGPRYYDVRHDNPPPFLQTRKMRLRRQPCRSPDSVVEVDYLVSSGCLIPMEAYDAVGVMEEQLFIDYIDIEWGLRARRNGFHCFGVCGAEMKHFLGNSPIELLGRRFPCRSPLRHYYMFRNAVWMYRQGWIPTQWKVVDGWRLIAKYFFYSLFALPRLRHLRMMSLGVGHGLLGRMGSYD